MSKAKILIVEDEGLTAFALQRKLKKWGYEVPTFTVSGKDAVHKVEELKPDLVLLDINLKGELDGLEAAEEIIKDQDTPIIFTTAYDDEKMINRAYDMGAAGYITKPYEEKELKENIQKVLSDKIEDQFLNKENEIIEKSNVLNNVIEENAETSSSEQVAEVPDAINEEDLEVNESQTNNSDHVIDSEVLDEIIENLETGVRDPEIPDDVVEEEAIEENKTIEHEAIKTESETKNINLEENTTKKMSDVLEVINRRYNIIESHVVQSNGNILYSNSMPGYNNLDETLNIIATSKKMSESRDNKLERIFFIGDKMQTLITLSPDIALIFSLKPDANIGMVSLVMKNAFNEIDEILNN